MTIDKISRINNIYKSNGNNKVNKTNDVSKKDSIQISLEGQKKAELEKYINIVKNSPDIRADKVAEAKKNLETYFSNNELLEKIINNISGKIADSITNSEIS